ncbi:MAG: dihydroorotase, partial [Pseudomonadota bacterium]
AFYRLPVNEGTLTLERTAPDYPSAIETEDGPVTIFDPGVPLAWRVV